MTTELPPVDPVEAITSTAEDWRRRYRAEALERLPCADCWSTRWTA